MSRTRDPQAFVIDAVVTPWDTFSAVCAISALQLLLHLLHRIKVEDVLVIMSAPAWPRRMWYADIINLVQDKPWAFQIFLFWLFSSLVWRCLWL